MGFLFWDYAGIPGRSVKRTARDPEEGKNRVACGGG